MEKKVTSPAAMGLFVALVLIVLSLVTYFADLYGKSWIQYLGLIVLCGGVIFAVLNNGKEQQHEVTFGRLFGFGLKVTAAATCVMILYAWLQGLIFPDIKMNIVQNAREQLSTQPDLSAADLERNLKMYEDNFLLLTIIGILFGQLITGAIASLIGAAVAKKRPVADFDKI